MWESHRDFLIKTFTVWVIATVLILNIAGAVSTASAQSSTPNDYFDYNRTQKVNAGEGAYRGYRETTSSSGHYEVISVNGTEVTMEASYTWKYSSSETYHTISGSEFQTFSFSTETRKYTQGYDLDTAFGSDPSIWFWVSPDVTVGQTVRILDKNFTVKSTNLNLWIGAVPYKAILLESYGSGIRNDAYGNFYYTYTDRYYFHPGTGYIIAERYTEHDGGHWQGHSAAFDWAEDLTVTDTSYSLDQAYLLQAIAYLFIFAIIVGLFLFIYWLRWFRRTPNIKTIGHVRISRIWKVQDIPHLPNRASELFGPFIEDFCKKALMSGGRVAMATSDVGLHGIAIYHRDVKMGAILCPNYELNEKLRKFIGTKDFFSEVRHSISDRTIKEYGDYGLDIPKGSYNVFETYRVLKQSQIVQQDYDSSTVRLMEEGDIDRIARISKELYKTRSKKWIRVLLKSGDIGFVAEVDGRIVGFAFATILGTYARFHTLTVIKEMRGRGIGKSLMRARLHIAHVMGAREAIVEIADWNTPSLSISSMFGFKKVGAMYVETVRTKRIKKNIVRR